MLKNHTAKQHLAHVDHFPILKHGGLFCLYNMLDLVINQFMPPQYLRDDVGYIFWKESFKNQIAQWKKTYGKSCTWRANSNKSMVIGKNQFNPMNKAFFLLVITPIHQQTLVMMLGVVVFLLSVILALVFLLSKHIRVTPKLISLLPITKVMRPID
mmetsp:Transcript_6195/g.6684  ORF Transcript_6195/g.6684 Transcript_6195/m.6684 type:complete len:156 (-) Transcript_6195:293-760(-)